MGKTEKRQQYPYEISLVKIKGRNYPRVQILSSFLEAYLLFWCLNPLSTFGVQAMFPVEHESGFNGVPLDLLLHN